MNSGDQECLKKNKKNPSARTNIKSRCVSAKGVNLWNGCDEEFKKCSSLCVIKKNV